MAEAQLAGKEFKTTCWVLSRGSSKQATSILHRNPSIGPEGNANALHIDASGNIRIHVGVAPSCWRCASIG